MVKMNTRDKTITIKNEFAVYNPRLEESGSSFIKSDSAEVLIGVAAMT